MAKRSQTKTSRRSFVEVLTLAGIGGQALLQTRDVRAAVATAQQAADKMPGAEAWPQMAYRTLGPHRLSCQPIGIRLPVRRSLAMPTTNS